MWALSIQQSQRTLRPLVCLLGLVTIPGQVLAEAPRNLLLITIDTLRADHLSCNGAENVATPNLDRLAREGVNFSRVRAPVPLTLPSHASILTGNYPPTHGVRENAAAPLSEDQLTLQEVLQSNGYETAAFLGSFVLDRRFGLAQGFDVYDDRVWTSAEELEKLQAERPAEAVFDAFEDWLADRVGQRPFFAWLHFYDPHAPYLPPEPYRTRYRGNPYAGEVAYADEVVGRVWTTLESRALLPRTVIGVVGDHGEGLGEHQEATHSVLIYNSTLHVPMILYSPGQIPAGSRVKTLTSLVDLAPTLLDLVGFPHDLGIGRSLFPRIGLSKAAVEQGDEQPRSVYSESLYAQRNLGWSPLFGVEGRDFKLILGAEPELFDLGADPEERRNLAAERPETVSALKEQFATLGIGLETASQEEEAASLDPETVARLRSLGYLSSPRGSKSEAAAGPVPDPKEQMEVWNEIQLALAEFTIEDFTSAATRLEKLLASHPDISLGYEYLGSAYEKMGRLSNAVDVYRKGIERGLGSSELSVGLGRIYLRRGDLPLAESALRVALSEDPLHVVALHQLADVEARGGNLAEATARYRQALEINPAYVYSWNGLGMALGRLGQDDEAAVAFQKAVELDPRVAPFHFNLALQLERMGRNGEARFEYEEFLTLTEGGRNFAQERALAEDAIERLER